MTKVSISKYATNNVCEMTDVSKTEFMRNSHLCCKFCNKEFKHRVRHREHELQCEVIAFNILHNVAEKRLDLNDCFDNTKNKNLRENIYLNNKLVNCKSVIPTNNEIITTTNVITDNVDVICITEPNTHMLSTLNNTTKPDKPKKKIRCCIKDADIVVKPAPIEISVPIPITTDIDNNEIIYEMNLKTEIEHLHKCYENNKPFNVCNNIDINNEIIETDNVVIDDKNECDKFVSSSNEICTDTFDTDYILSFDNKSFELDEIKHNEYDDIYTYIVDNIELINDTHTYYKCKTRSKYSDIYYILIRKHRNKPNVIKLKYVTYEMMNLDFMNWKLLNN